MGFLCLQMLCLFVFQWEKNGVDLGGWGGEEGLGGSSGGEMVIRIDQNIFYEISLFSTKNKRGEREKGWCCSCLAWVPALLSPGCVSLDRLLNWLSQCSQTWQDEQRIPCCGSHPWKHLGGTCCYQAVSVGCCCFSFPCRACICDFLWV